MVSWASSLQKLLVELGTMVKLPMKLYSDGNSNMQPIIMFDSFYILNTKLFFVFVVGGPHLHL